ncbi:uncharacterized protein LOC142180992 [Nicotiana tabacum]|uniref:Uncharacterized protein LOC142180992 n=2 Tax=Nicotiana TaxID=4085 RepID=A0AC58UI92_TOBAC
MVADVFGIHFDFETHESVEKPPNEEAKYFYKQLEDASRPLREGSMHSQLSVAIRLLGIKLYSNISQAGMDSFIGLISELVDPTFNISEDLYKAKRLVSKVGLSSMRIDCCEDSCMSHYKGDTDLESCKFFEKPRFKRVSSGKNVAVNSMHYLPLIPRLKRLYTSLWCDGVETYDISTKQNFNLRASLMWTINDFPVYGMSGWMTVGKLACPYSMQNVDHEFRRMKNTFKKNTVEHDLPPPVLSGEEIWERFQNFTKVTEAPPSKFPRYGVTHNWKKQSIF